MKARQPSIPSSPRLRKAGPSSPRLRRASWGARGAAILAATAVIGLLGTPGWADPTNYWTNSFGGDWNVAGNWTNTAGAHEVPGASNFTVLPNIGSSGYTVNYTTPMSATSIPALYMPSPASGVTNVLNINADGFVVNGVPGVGVMGSFPVWLEARTEIDVNSGGVLTVTNCGNPPQAGGVLNINGGTVNMLLSPGWGYLSVGGVLNMNSGTLTVTFLGIYAVSGTINFRGGVINTEGLSLGGLGYVGTMTMTNGTLITSRRNCIGDAGGGIFGANGPGMLTVSGGSVTNSGSFEVGGGTNGTINVSGGSWAQLSVGGYGVYLGAGGGIGTLNISGTAQFNSIGLVLGNDTSAGTYGALNVSNGVFQATNGTATALLNVNQGALTLSGGTVRVDKLTLQDNALTNTLKFVATPGNTNMGVVNVSGLFSNAASARLVVDMSQYTEWRAGVTSVLLVTYGTLSTPFSSGNIVVTPPPMLPMRITVTVDQTTGNRIQVNLRVPKGTIVSGR